MSNVWQALQPVYYREVFDGGEKASISVGRIFSIFSYITLFPIIIGLLFAQEIIETIFPSSYHGAIDVVIILGAAITTQTFGMYVSVQYAYSKRPFWIFPVTVFGSILNVGLNICLIPKYGLIGAGFATAVSMVCVNIFLLCIGQRLYKIEYEWKIIASFYLNIIGVLITILFLRRIVIGNIYLYLIKLSFLFIYFYLGIRSDIVNLKSIKSFVKSLSYLAQKNNI